MSDLPERIWVEHERIVGHLVGTRPFGSATEYLRADIAAERERRLVEALHRVGLAERDSGTTKQCQEARAALKEIEHE